jgi:hypothetical protein
VRQLHIVTLIALVASGVVAVGLFALGVFQLTLGHLPTLFGLTLTALGALAGALVVGGLARHRPSWAFLIAIWGVVGFCAFFTAPKVLRLPKITQVTVELEERLGREKAEAQVDSTNFKTRLEVLGVCVGFLLPFGLLCTGLAIGRRDFESVG